MNNLEKYLDQVIEQKPIAYDSPLEPEQQVPLGIARALRRRWYIVALIFVAACASILPAIWFLMRPNCVVTGAVHVAPLMPSILTGEPDHGEISDYDSYLNTQAATILSRPVLMDVADDLKDQNLSFFQVESLGLLTRLRWKLRTRSAMGDMVEILKAAIADGTVFAAPIRRTELIGVTVKSPDEREAKLIVNSFLDNFQNRYGSSSEKKTNATLTTLETKIRGLESEIRELTQEVGTTEIQSLQSVEMQRQMALWTEKTRVEARRIGLEASMKALEQAGDSNSPPEQLMAAQKEYINADSMVQSLTASIVEMKRALFIAGQNLAPENPELARKRELLKMFEDDLHVKKKELATEFEARVDEHKAQRLASVKAERDQLWEYEEMLRQALASQDTTTRQVGQTGVAVQDKQFELGVSRELYDQILRRKRNVEVEFRRTVPSGRIQLAYEADVASIEDKRVKYSAIALFLALGCSVGLAIVRDRMDKTLQTPDDVVRQLDLPVIGTTTSSRTVKPALFAEHLAGDYQTIRTNLSLLTSGGMPKRLAVSSAGTREGKTTFAVNLATSLAKAGKKVLLVDGDLRKPDIAYMLSILNGSAGLQDVLLGGDFSKAIHVVPASGLHVLVANPQHSTDAYELLTSITAAEQIEKLARQYDHMIVDTPPALAFPDALMWAKLTDAVVLVGFAGQTIAPDLKEAKERFTRVRARVLGAVLSNVPAGRSLYRNTYSYRPTGPQAKYKARMARKLLLLTHSPTADARPNVDAGDELR